MDDVVSYGKGSDPQVLAGKLSRSYSESGYLGTLGSARCFVSLLACLPACLLACLLACLVALIVMSRACSEGNVLRWLRCALYCAQRVQKVPCSFGGCWLRNKPSQLISETAKNMTG